MNGEALPTVIPARRMQQQREPDHIDGKLGYYCMAIETAITSGHRGRQHKASAAIAQTGQKDRQSMRRARGVFPVSTARASCGQ